MKCLALAIVPSTLIAEDAYACPPCGPSMPSAPSMSTPYVPSAPRVSPLTVPGVGAVQSAVRDAVDFASIKTKVRAKNPNATEAQIEAGTQKVIERRKRRDDELTAYIREGMAEYRRKQRDEEFRNRIDKEVAERRQRENERMLREDDQRIRQGLIDMGLKAARERREREIEDMHALIESKNNMDKFMKELEAKRLAKEGGQSLISGLNHEERMMLGPGLVWMLPPVHLPH